MARLFRGKPDGRSISPPDAVHARAAIDQPPRPKRRLPPPIRNPPRGYQLPETTPDPSRSQSENLQPSPTAKPGIYPASAPPFQTRPASHAPHVVLPFANRGPTP